MEKRSIMHRIIRHLRAVIVLGFIVALFSYMALALPMFFTILSDRYPWLLPFGNIIDRFVDVLYFPAMWIKPQTMFDNTFWLLLSIGVFWGIAIHFAWVGIAAIWRSRNNR